MTTDERLNTATGVATRPLWVGGKLYNIPASSRAVHPAKERLAYLLDAAGRVYVLTESGEVEAPPELAAQLAAEFFPGVSPG